MKFYILALALIAGVFSSPIAISKLLERNKYGEENGNKDDNVKIDRSKEVFKNHGNFVHKIGFVNYRSPLWNYIKNFSNEELESFVEELKSLPPRLGDETIEDVTEHNTDVVIVPDVGVIDKRSGLWTAMRDMSYEERAIFTEQLREIKDDKRHSVVDLPATKSVDNNMKTEKQVNIKDYKQELLNILKSMTPNQLTAFARKATALYGRKYLEDVGLVIQKNILSQNTDIMFVPGFGFVDKKSDLWSTLDEMSIEERAVFKNTLQKAKKQKEFTDEDASEETSRDDFAVEVKIDDKDEELPRKIMITYVAGLGFVKEGSDLWNIVKSMNSEQIEIFLKESTALYGLQYLEDLGLMKQKDLFSRTENVVSLPGLGFVKDKSPLWTTLKEMTEEQRVSYIEQLKESKEFNNKIVDIDSYKLRREFVPYDDDEKENPEQPSRKRIFWLSGVGFVKQDSTLWNIIKSMAPEEIAAYINEVTIRYGQEYLQDIGMIKRKYTTKA